MEDCCFNILEQQTMPESSNGSPPAGNGDRNSQSNSNRASTGSKRGGKNRNKHRNNCEGKFEGKCAELKGAVYDIVAGKDTFLKTTQVFLTSFVVAVAFELVAVRQSSLDENRHSCCCCCCQHVVVVERRWHRQPCFVSTTFQECPQISYRDARKQ